MGMGNLPPLGPSSMNRMIASRAFSGYNSVAKKVCCARTATCRHTLVTNPRQYGRRRVYVTAGKGENRQPSSSWNCLMVLFPYQQRRKQRPRQLSQEYRGWTDLQEVAVA